MVRTRGWLRFVLTLTTLCLALLLAIPQGLGATWNVAKRACLWLKQTTALFTLSSQHRKHLWLNIWGFFPPASKQSVLQWTPAEYPLTQFTLTTLPERASNPTVWGLRLARLHPPPHVRHQSQVWATRTSYLPVASWGSHTPLFSLNSINLLELLTELMGTLKVSNLL